jgi:nucleoside 2-deoxyribosyltransferase
MENIIYAPDTWQAAEKQKVVFLAGSIAMGQAEDWQQVAGNYLAKNGILALNPRRLAWDSSWVQTIDNAPFREQVEWELDGLERADKIVFYFDPSTQAPITLLELGLWAKSGKCIVCCPAGYWRKGNVDIVCKRYGIEICEDLSALLQRLAESI